MLIECEGEVYVVVCMVDMSCLQFVEVFNQGKNDLLVMVVIGQFLQVVLDWLIGFIELQFEGLYCSVLLLDLDGCYVYVGVGLCMLVGYMQVFEGLEIGLIVGFCGMVMFEDCFVVVDNIVIYLLWVNYCDLVVLLGLCVCWFMFIYVVSGVVVGSFVMYYCEVCCFSVEEFSVFIMVSQFVGLVIDQVCWDEEWCCVV